MDTAPAGDRRSWRHEPFAAEIVGARMLGRGAADAKASLVAMLAAVGALVEVLPLHGTLVFTAVSDEEVGGINGTEFLVDRGLVHPDHVVVGEITHNRLAVAEKGIVWMRVITHGRAAHGSTPWRSEEHTSELQSPMYLVCRLLLEKKNTQIAIPPYEHKHTHTHNT